MSFVDEEPEVMLSGESTRELQGERLKAGKRFGDARGDVHVEA